MNKKPSPRDLFWYNHVEKFLKSDMSQANYCKKHDLNKKSFSVRKSQYFRAKKAKQNETKDVFIPLNTPPSNVRIKLSTGLELIFDKTPDPAWMANVLQSLGSMHDQY